jgi:hypothetical protein
MEPDSTIDRSLFQSFSEGHQQRCRPTGAVTQPARPRKDRRDLVDVVALLVLA